MLRLRVSVYGKQTTQDVTMGQDSCTGSSGSEWSAVLYFIILGNQS